MAVQICGGGGWLGLSQLKIGQQQRHATITGHVGKRSVEMLKGGCDGVGNFFSGQGWRWVVVLGGQEGRGVVEPLHLKVEFKDGGTGMVRVAVDGSGRGVGTVGGRRDHLLAGLHGHVEEF